MTAKQAKEVQHVLNKQLAYLTGSMDGPHPILIFPKVGLKKLLQSDSATYDELLVTMKYFRSILSDDLVSNGLTVLVEATSSSTGPAVKAVLEMLASEDNGFVYHIVYVLIKATLFGGKTKPLVAADIMKKLHITLLTPGDLSQLDITQIPKEMGGLMAYSHQGWIKNRLEYERIQSAWKHTKEVVGSMRSSLDHFELPCNVAGAEFLIEDSLQRKEVWLGVIDEMREPIHTVLNHLNHPGEEEVGMAMTKAYNSMIASLGEMLEELKEEEKGSNAFWTVHKARLDHILRVCQFRKSADKILDVLKEFSDILTTNLAIEINKETAIELGLKHNAFVVKCREVMDGHMASMKEESMVLFSPDFLSDDTAAAIHPSTQKAVDLVLSTMQGLAQAYKTFLLVCGQKRDFFTVTIKFHLKMEEVEMLSQEALEFLASQPLDDITATSAGNLMTTVDEHLSKLQPQLAKNLRKMAKALPGRYFNTMGKRTAKKLCHTRDLLDSRKTEPLPPAQTNGSNHVDGILPDVKAVVESEEMKACVKVYQELITTEKEYITDLHHAISSYYEAVDDEGTTLPVRLRGKRNIVFGNIVDIHRFHNSKFLSALLLWEQQPERVGQSFLHHAQDLNSLYPSYCRNNAHSEAIVSDNAECEAFFREFQLKIGDKRPLYYYLIKPVQRITKYRLLLKDMIRCSENAPQKIQSELKAALDKILDILQASNDSLALLGLRGYPETLNDRGKLLLQDSLKVWDGPERRFFSGKDRQVFLFEKVLVFSKKVGPDGLKKLDNTYSYKCHLQVSQLALLKKPLEAQSLSFELAVINQQRAIKLRAPTKETRDLWVAEIKRLLQLQVNLAEGSITTMFLDDEFDEQTTEYYEPLVAGVISRYVATCDYIPDSGADENIALQAGQVVEVIGVNQDGWWWVRPDGSQGSPTEGWVPASYLVAFKEDTSQTELETSLSSS
ncbi:hypothetical protein EMCRGX_G025283 [Ephydatia muelleri]